MEKKLLLERVSTLSKEEINHFDKVIDSDLTCIKKRINEFVFDSEMSPDERELENLFNFWDKRRKEQHEKALQRIGNGTYGVCTDCGHNIESKRLHACPTTERCVPCAFKEACER
jgi:RNA polymerase-binding transcription factor DksA